MEDKEVYMNGTEAQRLSGSYPLWLIISLIALVIGGVIGLYSWFVPGLHHISRDIVTGVLLASYTYFVGITTGLCVIAALGHLFGFDTYEAATSRAAWLAIVSLLAGFFAIAFDLGHPIKLLYLFFISPNLSAPIWFMAFFYILYLIFAIVEFILLMSKKYGIAIAFGAIAIIFDVIARANVGFVFGSTIARPFWLGAFPSFFFIALSMTSGMALFMLCTVWVSKMRGVSNPELLESSAKLQTIFLLVVALFYIWYIVSGKFGLAPGRYEATKALIAGPLSVNFYLFEIICGIIIPFILLAASKGKSATVVFIASALVIIGTFSSHYDFCIAGQIVPVWQAFAVRPEYAPMYAHYHPSMIEILTVMGAYGLLFFLFFLGEGIFKFRINGKAE
jgi:molybdopterin-containing oxidoreductase family membrane subunit